TCDASVRGTPSPPRWASSSSGSRRSSPMAEQLESAVRPPRAYAFPLATFHVCLLVLVFVVLGYPDLAGIAELNTALGLLVFALLWSVSYYGTAWALRDVRVHAVDVAMRRGIGG